MWIKEKQESIAFFGRIDRTGFQATSLLTYRRQSLKREPPNPQLTTGYPMEYLQSFLTEPLVANQVEMSLLHHGFAELGISFNQNSPRYPDGWEGTMEYCRTKRVLLQAWSPLAQGILMGKLDGEPENIKKTATLVQEYARRHQTTAEAILVAWLLKHPAKIQPVLGTTRPDRLRACADSLSISLSRDEWYSLFAAARGASMP